MSHRDDQLNRCPTCTPVLEYLLVLGGELFFPFFCAWSILNLAIFSSKSTSETRRAVYLSLQSSVVEALTAPDGTGLFSRIIVSIRRCCSMCLPVKTRKVPWDHIVWGILRGSRVVQISQSSRSKVPEARKALDKAKMKEQFWKQKVSAGKTICLKTYGLLLDCHFWCHHLCWLRLSVWKVRHDAVCSKGRLHDSCRYLACKSGTFVKDFFKLSICG